MPATDDELLAMAHDLYARLGGLGQKDARIVRALWERWQSARTPGPATLVWSSEPPKVAGDYKVKEMDGSTWFATFDEDDVKCGNPDTWGCRFAGPIPEPREPGEEKNDE